MELAVLESEMSKVPCFPNKHMSKVRGLAGTESTVGPEVSAAVSRSFLFGAQVWEDRATQSWMPAEAFQIRRFHPVSPRFA